MSNLGFAAGSFKASRPVTANRLFRGPPNPKMEQFYEAARKKREEAIAAQKMATEFSSAAATANTPTTPAPQLQKQSRPTTAPPPQQPKPTPASSRSGSLQHPRPVVGGIESQIAEARSAAETAQHQIAAVRNNIEERVSGVEVHVAAATSALKDVKSRLDDLEAAARDAWMATFWMYGDVVVRSAQFSKPPPGANTVAFVDPGALVILVGEMVDTPVGPAMAARAVDDLGQISVVWMLLRDDTGRELITNFRLAP